MAIYYVGSEDVTNTGRNGVVVLLLLATCWRQQEVGVHFISSALRMEKRGSGAGTATVSRIQKEEGCLMLLPPSYSLQDFASISQQNYETVFLSFCGPSIAVILDLLSPFVLGLMWF